MATYNITLSESENTATLDEQHIYGASRIGMRKPEILLYDNAPISYAPSEITQNTLGETYFEISNYLGNVNAVITDRKIYTSTGTSLYEAVVISTTDFYPFGMEMPNPDRIIGDAYRFGYNSMEKDIEVSGNGNSYTTEFRQYDPRLGRWKSVDPLMAILPSNSPYVAFNNNPIFYVDPQGLIGGPANKKLDLPNLKMEEVSTGQKVIDVFPQDAYIDFSIAASGKTQKDINFYDWYYDKNKTETVSVIIHHGNANINGNLRTLDGGYDKYDAGGKQGGHVMIHIGSNNNAVYGFTGAGVKDTDGNGSIDVQKEVPLFPTVNPESADGEYYSRIHGNSHYGSWTDINRGNIKNGGLTTIFTLGVNRQQYYALLSFYQSNVGKSPYAYSIINGERCASSVMNELEKVGILSGNHGLSPVTLYNYLYKNTDASSRKLIISNNVIDGSLNVNKIFLGGGCSRQESLNLINQGKGL